MYTFDFQQNLPIPDISGDMFYIRMLWVYNFVVHDGSNSDGIMHLWDETIAERGSVEVDQIKLGTCVLPLFRGILSEMTFRP